LFSDFEELSDDFVWLLLSEFASDFEELSDDEEGVPSDPPLLVEPEDFFA
jgi:hypothetical protein